MDYKNIKKNDPDVFNLIKSEEDRQGNKLSMIASENFTSKAVREALSSVFVHKYAEGQINERYYEGNQFIDELDSLCKKRVKDIFLGGNDWHVNIQALSGSNANLAVYNGLLSPGDTILSMFLPDGGHLSHGWSFPEKEENGLKGVINQSVYLGGSRKISIVSKMFNIVQYKVDPNTKLFDYDEIKKHALKYKPKMIVSGGTAYPREINYERLAEIAKEVGAYYLADVSHEAGLIAAGVNINPVNIADIVTFTTHKTLRGPRGAIILCRKELAPQIDYGVFPGLQGGPFEHSIAAISVCLKEAMKDEFKSYASQVVKNAQHLAKCLIEKGYDVVTGGTDKHLIIIDLRNKNLSGRNPAKALDLAGIVINRNSVPLESGSPMNPSGLRIGTPTITTRGMKEKEIEQIADWIDQVIIEIIPYSSLKAKNFVEKIKNSELIKSIATQVKDLCNKFPLDI